MQSNFRHILQQKAGVFYCSLAANLQTRPSTQLYRERDHTISIPWHPNGSDVTLKRKNPDKLTQKTDM